MRILVRNISVLVFVATYCHVNPSSASYIHPRRGVNKNGSFVSEFNLVSGTLYENPSDASCNPIDSSSKKCHKVISSPTETDTDTDIFEEEIETVKLEDENLEKVKAPGEEPKPFLGLLEQVQQLGIPTNPFTYITYPIFGPIIYTLFSILITNLSITSVNAARLRRRLEEAATILENINNFEQLQRGGANVNVTRTTKTQTHKLLAESREDSSATATDTVEEDVQILDTSQENHLEHKIGTNDQSPQYGTFNYVRSWLSQVMLRMISTAIQTLESVSDADA